MNNTIALSTLIRVAALLLACSLPTAADVVLQGRSVDDRTERGVSQTLILLEERIAVRDQLVPTGAYLRGLSDANGRFRLAGAKPGHFYVVAMIVPDERYRVKVPLASPIKVPTGNRRTLGVGTIKLEPAQAAPQRQTLLRLRCVMAERLDLGVPALVRVRRGDRVLIERRTDAEGRLEVTHPELRESGRFVVDAVSLAGDRQGLAPFDAFRYRTTITVDGQPREVMSLGRVKMRRVVGEKTPPRSRSFGAGAPATRPTPAAGPSSVAEGEASLGKLKQREAAFGRALRQAYGVARERLKKNDLEGYQAAGREIRQLKDELARVRDAIATLEDRLTDLRRSEDERRKAARRVGDHFEEEAPRDREADAETFRQVKRKLQRQGR